MENKDSAKKFREYDSLTMPPELRKFHAANDRAVLAAYGLAPDTTDS